MKNTYINQPSFLFISILFFFFFASPCNAWCFFFFKPMRKFQTVLLIPWKFVCIFRGTDVSTENLHQGFTHVFESTFESVEGVAEYLAHPAHVEFANEFLPAAEKVVVIDYKPTAVKLPWKVFHSGWKWVNVCRFQVCHVLLSSIYHWEVLCCKLNIMNE